MSSQILIVDDSLTVRMDLDDAFQQAGLSSLLCANLESARAALKREPIDLAVLDVLLPDGDGVDLLRDIRGNPDTASLPVLLLSTEAEVRDRVRGLVCGANGYIGKPYDRRDVIDRARELLRQRSAARANNASIQILLIEDSLTFRQALSGVLEGAGYAVRTAETGEEGLRLAALVRPDAILVDGQLPGIDGITVVHRLRSDMALRHVPCLLLTASSEKRYELQALEAGADNFVCKDEDTEVILSRLTAVLRSAVRPTPLEANASTARPRRILAVDDSPTFLETVTEELRQEGFEVLQSNSGEEALRVLAHEPVDLVLLDRVMPGLNGEQTCQRIKATPAIRDVPVLMLTAHRDQEAVLSCLNAGADDYIPKAAEFDVLKGRIRAQLRRKQYEGENRLIQEVIETVRKSEARFRGAFDHTNVAMVLSDLDDRIIRVNRAFAELFGYLADEMVGRSMKDVTHPDDIAESQQRKDGLRSADSNHFQLETRYLRRDGSVFWSLTNVSLVRSSDGVPLQYVSQVQDITERKQAEESNRRYNERLRILHEIDRALISGEGPAEIAAAALPPLRDLLGVRRAIVTLFDPATGGVEWLAGAGPHRVRTGEGAHYSAQYMGDIDALKRGEPQWIKVEELPPGPDVDSLLGAGIRAYTVLPMIVHGELIGALSFGGMELSLSNEQIGIAREVATQFAITIHHARMKLALQAKHEELREVSQQLWQTAKLATMGELAASIAHELNNPLGTVSLGIEELQSTAAPGSPESRELRVMEQETERMAALVANLLQFSRTGQQRISTVNVTEEIDKTMELSSFFLRKRKVNVIREHDPDLPYIQADRQKLRQVFLNLMVNASDAMPQGGTLTIRVTRTGMPEDTPAILMEFIDTGIGIPPENLAKIMEPFFTTKPEGQGTGLGLAICRRVVQEHHGIIRLVSEVGKGTAFQITLPIHNGTNGEVLECD